MTEDQFYHSLFQRLRRPPRDLVVPPGDDCAAFRCGGSDLLLVAIDQLVGERHYRQAGPDAAPPQAAGRKLLARNLSDIAAMGGRAEFAVVAMGLALGGAKAWLDGFMDGLLELADRFDVHLIGGDLSRTPSDTVSSLAILGRVPETEVVCRSGASAADALYATGTFGGALSSGHHLEFEPRCREGRWLAEQRFATAMIDVSDGVLLDAARLADASDVSIQIDPSLVPRRGRTMTEQDVLTEGEDYELLFTVSAAKAASLQRLWPFADVPLTSIGRVVSRSTAAVLGPGGDPLEAARPGFDHFMQ